MKIHKGSIVILIKFKGCHKKCSKRLNQSDTIGDRKPGPEYLKQDLQPVADLEGRQRLRPPQRRYSSRKRCR